MQNGAGQNLGAGGSSELWVFLVFFALRGYSRANTGKGGGVSERIFSGACCCFFLFLFYYWPSCFEIVLYASAWICPFASVPPGLLPKGAPGGEE